MGEINLKGMLNLAGTLTLKDKVKINGIEALVVLNPLTDAPQTSAAVPIIQPPPPATPTDAGTSIWVTQTPNMGIKAGQKLLVAGGMAQQGGMPAGAKGPPSWPGTMPPSTLNPGVTINQVAINVVGDLAAITPPGAPAPLTSSGQS